MLRMWLVALAMFAALSGTASAQEVFDDNPAAVSFGAGNVELFARGQDGRVLHRSLNAGAWSDWRAVDGLTAGSGPGAVIFGQTLYLFARGTDGALWQNILQGGAWSGWVSLGGGLTSAPGVGLRRNSGVIDLFVRGTDNAMHHRALVPGQGWAGWEYLGGNMTSGPAAIGYSSTGSIDAFVRDAGGGLSTRYWAPSAGWVPADGWSSVGGGITGAPATATPANDVLDVYVRGSGNDWLWHRRHGVDPAGIYRVVDRTPITSSPAVVSDRPTHEFVFARIGGELHWRSVTGAETLEQNWGAWASLGPVALPTPVAPPPPPPPPPPLQTLNPRLTWTYKAARKSTKLGSLTLSRIAKGATVKVTCTKGCSAKRWTTRPKKSTLSLKRFTRRSIAVGRSIRIEVSKPGTIASVKTLQMRRKKAPRLTSRCLPPGAKRVQRCAI